jgi:hypothetical protein
MHQIALEVGGWIVHRWIGKLGQSLHNRGRVGRQGGHYRQMGKEWQTGSASQGTRGEHLSWKGGGEHWMLGGIAGTNFPSFFIARAPG